jgi:hypothetical protein
MKNDNIAPPPLAIVRLKRWQVLVCQAALLERLSSARYQAESCQRLGGVSAALALDSLLERPIRGKQVHILERRGLIDYLVRRKRPSHGAFAPDSTG